MLLGLRPLLVALSFWISPRSLLLLRLLPRALPNCTPIRIFLLIMLLPRVAAVGLELAIVDLLATGVCGPESVLLLLLLLLLLVLLPLREKGLVRERTNALVPH